jgi:hypothetical protein
MLIVYLPVIRESDEVLFPLVGMFIVSSAPGRRGCRSVAIMVEVPGDYGESPVMMRR